MRLLLVILLLFPAFAYADAPLIYSKTVVRIIPSSDTVKSRSKLDDDDKKAVDSKVTDFLPSLQRVTKEFTVEVRPLSFLDQHDFIAHQPFTDKEGMMMLVDPPASAALKSANLLGNIDILFVLEDGTIEKIAPNLALNELVEPLTSEKPVRAFIFLKAGQAQASDIRPGDRIDNPLFKNHPVILQ